MEMYFYRAEFSVSMCWLTFIKSDVAQFRLLLMWNQNKPGQYLYIDFIIFFVHRPQSRHLGHQQQAKKGVVYLHSTTDVLEVGARSIVYLK